MLSVGFLEEALAGRENFSILADMKLLFVAYPRCGTCRKAQAWLDARGIAYEARHIVESPPSAEELHTWISRSGLPIKRFFNTSGLLYKSLSLKDKLPTLSEEEQIALLASDGMLVKRPILVSDHFVTVGFREEEWEKHLQ